MTRFLRATPHPACRPRWPHGQTGAARAEGKGLRHAASLGTDRRCGRHGRVSPSIQQWHMRRLDTEEEALAWIGAWHERWRAETDASWAITSTDGAALLGYVALRDIDLVFGFAEVTYWVLLAFRGHGIAPRACRAVADWAFAD